MFPRARWSYVVSSMGVGLKSRSRRSVIDPLTRSLFVENEIE